MHELGRKAASIEEKQNFYDALAAARDPKLAERALQISLTDELPTSRALYMIGKVARHGGHAELAWNFARRNMKDLLAKADALAVNRFAPGFFVFFDDPKWVAELENYAKESLPTGAQPAVAKAVDEIGFRADLKTRLGRQVQGLKERKPSPLVARP
jgi:aminopeptidase N